MSRPNVPGGIRTEETNKEIVIPTTTSRKKTASNFLVDRLTIRNAAKSPNIIENGTVAIRLTVNLPSHGSFVNFCSKWFVGRSLVSRSKATKAGGSTTHSPATLKMEERQTGYPILGKMPRHHQETNQVD
jgi:hypothetical protein